MRREKMMTYEEYLQFYQFPWPSNISRCQLNQIIQMHGFLKHHKETKARLQECLDSIELMEPTRSTLEESISSCAFMTAEEITMDLENLGWRECLLVRSIQTLKSKSEERFIAVNEDLPFIPCGATSADDAPRRRVLDRHRRRRVPSADFVIVGKRRRSKRKRVSVNALIFSSAVAAGSSVSSSSFILLDDAQDFVPPLPLSPPPMTPPPPSSPPPPLTPPPTDPFSGSILTVG